MNDWCLFVVFSLKFLTALIFNRGYFFNVLACSLTR